MIITNVTYSQADNLQVLIETSDLGSFKRPYPISTWESEFVQKWIDDGNTIQPYVEPADWQGFRHWLNTTSEGQAIMSRILTAAASNGAVGVINGWLMYELGNGDIDNVRLFVSQLMAAGVSFSPVEKDNVNGAALTYNLPKPIFD